MIHVFNFWRKTGIIEGCAAILTSKQRRKLWVMINCWCIFRSPDLKLPTGTIGKTLTNPVPRKMGSLQASFKWLIGSFASSKDSTLNTLLLPKMCLSQKISKGLEDKDEFCDRQLLVTFGDFLFLWEGVKKFLRNPSVMRVEVPPQICELCSAILFRCARIS